MVYGWFVRMDIGHGQFVHTIAKVCGRFFKRHANFEWVFPYFWSWRKNGQIYGETFSECDCPFAKMLQALVQCEYVVFE